MMRVVARGGSSFAVRPVGSQRVLSVHPMDVVNMPRMLPSGSSRYLMTTPLPSVDQRKSTRKHYTTTTTTTSAAATSAAATRSSSLSSTSRQHANNNHRYFHNNINRFFKASNVIVAVAAVVSLRPIMTMAEGSTATRASSSADDQPTSAALTYSNGQPCPIYGCPLYPLDIVTTPGQDPLHNSLHAPESLKSLEGIREKTRQELSVTQKVENEKDDRNTPSTNDIDSEAFQQLLTLETTARHDMATMTMTGFKGGTAQQQINQDRALAVGPYFIHNDNGDDSNLSSSASIRTNRRLLGVFDGHAARGEVVSEYVVKELPHMLARKLQQALQPVAAGGVQDDEVSTTKRVLHETFLELDRTAPADPSGGCTATVILQQGEHVYVANAGDSQSLIGIYRASTKTTTLAYVSREDKPELPDERKRVEAMGGYVYVPPRGTSRVVWVNPRTGAQTGLAMSRSLGDWTFGKIGVIPDPIVDVLSIPDVVQQELQKTRAEASVCWTVDDDGVVVRSLDNDSEECRAQNEPPLADEEADDVYVFAVSATDGMLDYVAKEGIAQVVAHSLFDDTAPHPATACELLVSTAAQGWEKYRQGRYRDDIAIAISVLRTPPSVKHVDSAETVSKTAPTQGSDEL